MERFAHVDRYRRYTSLETKNPWLLESDSCEFKNDPGQLRVLLGPHPDSNDGTRADPALHGQARDLVIFLGSKSEKIASSTCRTQKSPRRRLSILTALRTTVTTTITAGRKIECMCVTRTMATFCNQSSNLSALSSALTSYSHVLDVSEKATSSLTRGTPTP